MDGLITFGHIILAILVLLAMVTIHELGHYVAGIVLKFKINEFAVGFGPVVAIPKFWDRNAMARIRARRIASKQEGYVQEVAKLINKDYLFRVQHTSKRGENISLRWFPLGGFCAFDGEDASPNRAENGFNAQKPWKRLIVQFSGALFNILSAFIFCMIFIGVIGFAVPKAGKIHFDPNTNSAYEHVLQVGDEIVAVDGKRITVLSTYSELVAQYDKGDEYTFIVRRTVGSATAEQEVKGRIGDYQYTDKDGVLKTATGVGMEVTFQRQHHGFWQSIGYAFPYTFKLAGQVLGVLGQLLTGKLGISSIGGPVTTITMMGQYTQQSMEYLLLLLPLIAVNLGVFNLLPIPSLDGARMIFTLIEIIFRKPVPRKIENYIHGVGLIVMLGFVILIDLFHLIL